MIKQLAYLLIIFLPLSFAKAKQIAFEKKKLSDGYQFSYQWQDANDSRQSLNFSLTNKDLFSPFRSFKAFRSKEVDNFINLSIQREIRKNPIRGVQVNFEKTFDGTNVSLRARDQALLKEASEKIGALETEFRQKYLEDNFYNLFTDSQGDTGVKPDHVKIANLSKQHISALSSAIGEQVNNLTTRRIVNFILHFIQSIPYSTLESRLTSSGSGYNPPNKLLFENQGDCDSKVTLMASILKTLLPKLDVAIIYIPNHALIGIQSPRVENEAHININGIEYVLAEPTGPAKTIIGEIAPDSEFHIANGSFVAEVF